MNKWVELGQVNTCGLRNLAHAINTTRRAHYALDAFPPNALGDAVVDAHCARLKCDRLHSKGVRLFCLTSNTYQISYPSQINMRVEKKVILHIKKSLTKIQMRRP